MLKLGLQKFGNMWSKRKVEYASCSDLQHVLQTLGEKLSADETQANQKYINENGYVLTLGNEKENVAIWVRIILEELKNKIEPLN